LEQNKIRTYLALNGAVIFWGLSFVATKMALESFPTFTLVFARFMLASCFFLTLMLYKGFPSFTRKEHGKLLLIALFEPGLYFIFETLGLQYTTAPKASLIIATVPLAVTALAAGFLGERTNTAAIAGIALSLAGIAVLIAGDPQFSWSLKGSLSGDLLIFGAVISAAFYMICARELGQKHSATDITGLQIIYGALLFVPAFLWELPEIKWSAITVRSAGSLIYLTLFATVAGFICYNYALTQISASRASIFINAIPVVTAVGAAVMLGERLTLIQICGGAVVLSGVCLANFPGFRETAEKHLEVRT